MYLLAAKDAITVAAAEAECGAVRQRHVELCVLDCDVKDSCRCRGRMLYLSSQSSPH